MADQPENGTMAGIAKSGASSIKNKQNKQNKQNGQNIFPLIKTGLQRWFADNVYEHDIDSHDVYDHDAGNHNVNNHNVNNHNVNNQRHFARGTILRENNNSRKARQLAIIWLFI